MYNVLGVKIPPVRPSHSEQMLLSGESSSDVLWA